MRKVGNNDAPVEQDELKQMVKRAKKKKCKC